MDLTFSDIEAVAKKIGFMDFKQYCYWKKLQLTPFNDMMGRVDKSTNSFKSVLKKQKFLVNGIRCDTLEEVERRCDEEGIDKNTIKYYPEMEKDLSGLVITVHYMSPEFRSRYLEEKKRDAIRSQILRT